MSTTAQKSESQIILSDEGVFRRDTTMTFLGHQAELLKGIVKEPSLAFDGKIFTTGGDITAFRANTREVVIAMKLPKVTIKSRYSPFNDGGQDLISLAGGNAQADDPPLMLAWDPAIAFGPSVHAVFFAKISLTDYSSVSYFFIVDKKNNSVHIPLLPNIHSDAHICMGDGNARPPAGMTDVFSIARHLANNFAGSQWNDHLLEAKHREGIRVVRFNSGDFKTVAAPKNWQKLWIHGNNAAVEPAFVLPYLQ